VILTGLILFGFFPGAGGTVLPAAVAASVTYGWPIPKRRKKKPREEAIEAVELIQQAVDDPEIQARARALEASLRGAVAYASLANRARWAKTLAQEIRKRDDDDIAAVLLLIG